MNTDKSQFYVYLFILSKCLYETDTEYTTSAKATKFQEVYINTITNIFIFMGSFR